MKRAFVREMFGPEDDDDEGVTEPSWTDVSRAIDRLGEPDCTMIVLAGEQELPHLCIGGGRQGQYILYVMHSEGLYTAVDPAAGEEPVTIVTGGEAREFPSRMCIGEAEVLRAAKRFFESGDLEKSVAWSDE